MQTVKTSRARKLLAGTLCALAAMVLLGDGSSWAGGERKDSAKRVKVFASASAMDATGKQTVFVTLVIDKGWHLYANPVKCKSYLGQETVIEVFSNFNPVKADIRYPVGKTDVDYMKNTFMIYENRVDITAIVQRAPGDTGPLHVTASVNACNTNTCLSQSKITIPVK